MTSGMRETVAASTSLFIVRPGVSFEATPARLDFQAGTLTLSRNAGLETTKRFARASLPERTVLSIATPPKEWPSGTTSPFDCDSTNATKAAASSIHRDHESRCPLAPSL